LSSSSAQVCFSQIPSTHATEAADPVKVVADQRAAGTGHGASALGRFYFHRTGYVQTPQARIPVVELQRNGLSHFFEAIRKTIVRHQNRHWGKQDFVLLACARKEDPQLRLLIWSGKLAVLKVAGDRMALSQLKIGAICPLDSGPAREVLDREHQIHQACIFYRKRCAHCLDRVLRRGRRHYLGLHFPVGSGVQLDPRDEG